MSWLISVVVAGFIFSNPNFPAENFTQLNTPQVVVSNPQTVLQGDETEKFEQTYPLNANGRISVDNVNGSIVIEAWDRNEVKLEAVKIGDSRERLSEVEIKIDAKQDFLKVETEFGRNGRWNCNGYCRLEVQYKLMVPRGANLNEIETVNGSVAISNMTNYTKASAVNGSVKAINLRGTAEVETVNGVSEISFERLDNNSKINLSTVNGKVNLVIPSDSDVTIKAESVNGSINNEFNLPVRKGKWVGRDLYGKLGDGNVRISLESVNGGLNIKRQQDGKNPKNVTNLLNMKEDADDDEDEMDVNVDVSSVSKMNKEIAKSVKESVKVAANAPRIAAEALKEAEKEMANNSKEIQRAQRDAMRATRDAMRINQDAMRIAQDALRWEFSGANWSNTKVEEQSESFPVTGMPKVIVDAKKCSVLVKGWDRSEVKYRVTKIVRGKTQPNVNVVVNKTDSEIKINANVEGSKVSSNGGKDRNVTINDNRTDHTIKSYTEAFLLPDDTVRIEVFVPKKSNLRILTDREIRVEGITGNIDLSGNDGAINVRDSEGKLKLTAGNAMVRVIGFTGEIDSRTTDGTNFFEGDFAKFFAKTVDGKIILTLPEDADIDIQTESDIQSEGFKLSEIDGAHRIGRGGKT